MRTASTERTRAAVGSSVQVVLIDDHHLIRRGLRTAFEADREFEVVGEAGSAAEAIDLIDRVRPDVVVTDVQLPEVDGITLATRLRGQYPDLGIVVLTMFTGDDHLFAAMDAGASGFVGKDAPAEDVVAAARHAARRPGAFTARDLAAAVQRRSSAPSGPQLSPREREVLDLLVDGLEVQQISRRLFIAPSTVKAHVCHIYEKLGVGNRAQLVMAAVRLGLVGGAGH